MYNAAGSFKEVLRHLAEQPFLDGQMRKALERALARLADGDWQPRHTLDLNDLWSGHTLHREERGNVRSGRRRCDDRRSPANAKGRNNWKQ